MEEALKARNSEVSKTSTITYRILDEPRFEIGNLSYPPEISYSGRYNISLNLRHLSLSKGYNVTLTITNRKSERFDFPALDSDQVIILNFEGKNMRLGSNRVDIGLSYSDIGGKQYGSSQQITILFPKASLAERLDLILIELELWFEDLAGKQQQP